MSIAPGKPFRAAVGGGLGREEAMRLVLWEAFS